MSLIFLLFVLVQTHILVSTNSLSSTLKAVTLQISFFFVRCACHPCFLKLVLKAHSLQNEKLWLRYSLFTILGGFLESDTPKDWLLDLLMLVLKWRHWEIQLDCIFLSAALWAGIAILKRRDLAFCWKAFCLPCTFAIKWVWVLRSFCCFWSLN